MKKSPFSAMKSLGLAGALLGSILFPGWVRAESNVRDLGIVTDGSRDQTEAVQKILDEGKTDLWFPAGNYLLGTLVLPGGTQLRFSRGAVWKPMADKIRGKRLLDLQGDGIQVEGLVVDFLRDHGREFGFGELEAVIWAEGRTDLRFTGLQLERTALYESPDPKNKGKFLRSSPSAIRLTDCQNIEVDRCTVKNLYALLSTERCRRVSVHENRAWGGRHITDFNQGSESLRHYQNWSSGTLDQVRWWGGDSNDRKPNTMGSRAEVVQPGVLPSDSRYNANEAGVYDILVQGNYAEYGRTLGWGSKGRQIIFNANIAKFMSDMAYDSEGGENVTFSNNISINSRTAGIGCYFWSEKVVVIGNQILVQDEGDPKYQGDFIRLQSLSSHPEGRTGAGQVVISGNLFSSGLPKGLKYLKIESSRNLLITGNQFNNGGIQCKELACGPLGVKDNDFSVNRPVDSPVLKLLEGAAELIISGNTFRNTAQPGDFVEGEKVAAAVQLGSASGQRRVMENNQIFGWSTALQISGKRATASPCRFLIRNNLFGGRIDLAGVGAGDTIVFAENRDPETLQPLSIPGQTGTKP